MKQTKEIAKALGKNLPISRKHSIEIGRFIKGKTVERAKVLLSEVIVKRTAVPFKKFNKDTPHRKGKIAAGRYPVKASTEILNVLNSAYHNAVDKGMDAESLYIKTFIANKGEGEWHTGRRPGRKRKNTHIYIELVEKVLKRESKKQDKKPDEKDKKQESLKKVEEKPIEKTKKQDKDSDKDKEKIKKEVKEDKKEEKKENKKEEELKK